MGVVESWPHVFLEGEPGKPVALMLHGTGADENDLIRLGEVLLPGSPILSPRGTVNEQGMNRWFARLSEGVFDVDDVIAKAADLAGFVTEAIAHYGLEGRPIVAAGFSNGANIASATALLHPTVIPSVLAFSGMYPFGDRDPLEDASGVRLFLANGTSDPMAPQSSVERLEAVATSHGVDVTLSTRGGGHGISEEDLRAATQWLRA